MWDFFGAQSEKEYFMRKGYIRKSGAKQLNGGRMMTPSFFPGDLFPPGVGTADGAGNVSFWSQ